MDVGILSSFASYGDTPDSVTYRNEIEIAELVEPLGFDHLGAIEHHFTPLSISPASMHFLAYMAAKTKRINLLTGAVILPWHDPLRVVEQMTALDHLSQGRMYFGVGRGLARREYQGFGIDMNEARERFDEALAIVMRGVETGIVEGDGPYYKIPRVEIRPHPYASFNDRRFVVANSSDSIPLCAQAAARMMCFATKPWADMAKHFSEYRRLYEEYNNEPAAPAICADMLICDESADKVAAMAHKYIPRHYNMILDHYELRSNHFETTKGYGDHAAVSKALRESDQDEATLGYVEMSLWGTPQQILDKLDQRRQAIGEFDLTLTPLFGGQPTETVRRSMSLFASKVLPELKSWKLVA